MCHAALSFLAKPEPLLNWILQWEQCPHMLLSEKPACESTVSKKHASSKTWHAALMQAHGRGT